jgi:chorismate mutase
VGFSPSYAYQGRLSLHDLGIVPISGIYLAQLNKFHHCLGMNKPQTSLPETSSLNIGDVRSQIDSIDAALAELIVRRCGLSAAVAQAKRGAGDTSFGWRPGREIEILRTLLRDQPGLDPELAYCVWRALISANLAAQGDLTIIALEATSRAAEMAFSVGTKPEIAADAKLMMDALLANDHAIGILPWPDGQDWWVSMMAPAYDGLYVCAASPNCGAPPEVMMIAARPPEPAGDDISLVAGPIGAMEGGVLAKSGGFELVACGEFIAADTALPDGCRLIGCFAVV